MTARLACIGILLLVLLCGTASAALIPDFSAIPRSGAAPLDVQFTDATTGSPAGWAWYFGDENYSAPWTVMNASSGWSIRDLQSSVVLPDGSILLMGGNGNGGVRKNDTWRSSDNGLNWALMNDSSGWDARFCHGSVVLPDGSILLMGGNAGSERNDTWRSADNGATWTLVNASSGWSAREAFSTAMLPDGSVVLMGGTDGTTMMNDTWRTTDNGVSWTLMNASAGWTARDEQGSVVMPDGSVVLMGGNDGTRRNDTWRSTDRGATWTLMNASAGWTAREITASTLMPDGSIIIMGGYDGTFRNNVWRSPDKGATWGLVNGSADWSARNAHRILTMPDGSIVLMGGFDGAMKNDTWRFQPAGSSVQNPSHTYTWPGNYKVSLQVYNSVGYNSTRKAGFVTATGGAENLAAFISSAEYWASATGNTISSGEQPCVVDFNQKIINAADGSHSPLTNISVTLRSQDITGPGRERVCDLE